MARLPLNIGLNPYAQQRRQILGERLLGANSGVDPSARSYVEPRVGITATSQGNMMAGAGTETYGDIPFRVPYAKQQTPTVPMGLGGIDTFRRLQQQPQTPQSSMLAKIRSGLGASPTSPTGMALDSAAQSLLQQSGYSPVPRTTGQIFGEALGAAREGYMGGLQLEQAEAATIAAQKQQDLENQIANIELLIKAGEAESDILKNQAEMNLPFKGTSSFAQVSNILLTLSSKIADGTATEDEKKQYSLAYGKLSTPTKVTSTDPNTGDITVTEIPPQNLSGFAIPEGFELQTETKPSPKSLKDVTKNKDAIKMLQNLNEYRRTLMNPDYGKKGQAAGALGFLGGIQGQANSQAEALRLDLKELYDLGALVGGDFQILDRLLMNPNSISAIQSGKGFLIGQLDLLEGQLERDMNKRENQLFGTTTNPKKVGSLEEYNKVPNYLYVELPNGEIRYKTPTKGQ